MPSPLQEYQLMLANQGRLETTPQYNQAENAMGSGVTASAVGLNATLPIVQNNLKYADGFNRVAEATQKAGNALGIYGGYKSALGLTDPSRGEEAFANTLSPGNMLNTGIQYASYLNPITGTLQGINSLTQDEENPYGTIPGVSNFNQYVGEASNRINATGPGQVVMNTLGSIYDRTLGPVMSSTPGQLLHATASLPVSAVQTGFNAVKEAGEWVDRTLFGNYLPGLANEEKPDTMIWNDPTLPLRQNFDQFGNIMENNVYPETRAPAEQVEVGEMNDDWSKNALRELMTTIDATAGAVGDSVNIDVPTPGASYPDMELDDFKVFAGSVNKAYMDAQSRQVRDESDRFIDDPNNLSETGLGYTYVPDGFEFDPEVGLKLAPDFDSNPIEDTNDYSNLSDQDREVMQTAIEKANFIKKNKIFLDPTLEDHVLNQSTINEINTLKAYHDSMVINPSRATWHYWANWEKVFRKDNPTPRLGDYFLFNGSRVDHQTGRVYNPSNLQTYWANDIRSQIDQAIEYNYNTNYNHVDPYNTNYGTGGGVTMRA